MVLANGYEADHTRCITVGELIEALAQCDPTDEVHVWAEIEVPVNDGDGYFDWMTEERGSKCLSVTKGYGHVRIEGGNIAADYVLSKASDPEC